MTIAEEDAFSGDPYSYTTLMDLTKILKQKGMGPILRKPLPAKFQSIKDIQALFERVNKIRNRVMHPVKEAAWAKEDHDFLKTLVVFTEHLDSN